MCLFSILLNDDRSVNIFHQRPYIKILVLHPINLVNAGDGMLMLFSYSLALTDCLLNSGKSYQIPSTC